MRVGDVIGGYRIVSEPTNSGGGRCMWAFAQRDGRDYFIKRFLDPKRPKEGSTASARSVRLRMEACEEFERWHRTIMGLLRPDAVGGGNLVLTLDFFHDGTTYYKVTEQIHTASTPPPRVLTPLRKAVLLRTLGLSVELLHGIGVVHGDLKPGNVLVGQSRAGAYHTAKLIDFDDAYVSGRPPDREDIAGDLVFGAPEWRRYVSGDADVRPEWLTTRADVFSLGLMAHQYLTGALPEFGDRYASPADALNDSAELRIDERLSAPMRGLLAAMTARSPDVRPDMGTFLAVLRDPATCEVRASYRTSPGSRVRMSRPTMERQP
ncbi:serine/threonine protein kinase [Nonomuraea sp. NPDC052116]|uniref:protein kinase domain-containing protein n=1 Tax=Nonomuraea sp. NPDC052116 TaxID=3155665 RepID=UPI00342FDF5A